MKAQMNQPTSNTLGEYGLASTFMLFILSKIVSSEGVMAITIINGFIAILINIPKLVAIYKKYIRPLWRKE